MLFKTFKLFFFTPKLWAKHRVTKQPEIIIDILQNDPRKKNNFLLQELYNLFKCVVKWVYLKILWSHTTVCRMDNVIDLLVTEFNAFDWSDDVFFFLANGYPGVVEVFFVFLFGFYSHLSRMNNCFYAQTIIQNHTTPNFRLPRKCFQIKKMVKPLLLLLLFEIIDHSF